MKELYRFTLHKEVIKEEETVAADGTKTIKPVTIKEPVTFVIKKPSRPEKEEAQLYYGDIFRELSAPFDQQGQPKKHLLTKTQLQRQYGDSGGEISKNRTEYLVELYNATVKARIYFEQLVVEKAAPDDLERARKDWIGLRKLASDEQTRLDSMYSQTADVKAEGKVIIWLSLYLTYTVKDEVYTPYFTGTEDERFDQYDEIDEKNDEFSRALISKLLEYYSLVYMGAATSKEFENFEKSKEEEVA